MLCTARISVAESRWLIGNVDYMGFYRTNYDVAMWRRIIEQLHTDHTVSRLPLPHITVRLHFPAGCTTDCTTGWMKRFKY